MTTEEIRQYLAELNDELAFEEIKGEICLYGGAVMCLAFKARPATKDIDAIFEPVKEIRRAASKIAIRHHLNVGWLNFAVKMFVVPHEKQILLNLPNLKVFVPEADYLLAMKVLAARADTFDLDDIKFLIENLQIKTVEEVLTVVRNYYPNKEIKPEAQFFLEEILEKMITLKETKEKIVENPQWWKIALFDFVDDFRFHRKVEAVAEPFVLSDEKIDAVLASTAEYLCDEINAPIPEWLEKISACREPYFVAGIENLKAAAIVQSPLRFRIRKIFVLENFLSRV